MIDNKLKYFQKCSKIQNIDSDCLKKCIKWNLSVNTEELSSNLIGDYKFSSESSSKQILDITDIFPIDKVKLVINSSKDKFNIKFPTTDTNKLLHSSNIELRINVTSN